jgi:O-antigen ligase
MQMITQPMQLLRQAKFMGNMPRWAGNAVVALMTIFIFVIPFRFNTAIQEISFYTALFLAISLYTFKKKTLLLRSPLTSPFALFVTWAFIGLFFALNKGNSVHDFYAHLLKYLILFYLIINFFRTRKSFLLLAWALVISTSIFSLGLMIYFYLVSGNPLSARLLAINIPVNILSVVTIFACLIAANCLSRIKYLSLKIILVFCLFDIALSIMLTASRFSVSAMILSLLSLSFAKKRGLALITLMIILIFFFPIKSRLVTSDPMGDIKKDPRFFLSKPFVEMIKAHPLVGIGFGLDTYADKKLVEKYNAKLEKETRLGDQWIASFYYPHNIYIDIAARLGIVGLLLFFYIVFNYFRAGWLIMKHSQDDFLKSWSFCLMVSFFALLVIGMFESFLGFSVSIVLYIQCAMMMILWRIYSELPLQVGHNTFPQ